MDIANHAAFCIVRTSVFIPRFDDPNSLAEYRIANAHRFIGLFIYIRYRFIANKFAVDEVAVNHTRYKLGTGFLGGVNRSHTVLFCSLNTCDCSHHNFWNRSCYGDNICNDYGHNICSDSG